MKKMATLGLGIFLSIASSANFAPTRLTVSVEGNAIIKVMVDGSRFDQQYNNSTVFENLNPGYHSVRVYQLQDRYDWLGRGRTADYCLVCNTAVNIKPLFETSIVLNRFGMVSIDEQPIHSNVNYREWDKEDCRDKERRYDDNDRPYNRYNKNDEYRYNGDGNRNRCDQLMNNDDFFAVKRMLERESFDNTRMVIAKHIVDVNVLSSVQVKEMAQFFSFDNSKLEFLKYAYNKTIDQNNYLLVCNVLSFSSSKEQLMDYIRSCR